MYSVIRTENTPAVGGDRVDDSGDDSDGDSDDDSGGDDVEQARPAWRESKSRRRVLRTDSGGGGGGQTSRARLKTREETNRNQTHSFFGSKKIVSRQRNRTTEKKKSLINRSRKTEGQRRRERLELRTGTGAKKNFDERLQKVKHLFQLIKVSKKQKSRSQDRSEENVKSSKFHNFPLRRRASALLGDNSNDAIIVRRKEKKVSKVSALEKLYKIAGDDWVKTHIER